MSRRFTLRSGPQEVEIVPREEMVDFPSAESTLSYLRQFLGDGENRAVLRRYLAEGGLQLGGRHFSDEDLLVVLAHRIATGELRILTRRMNQPKPPLEAPAETTPREVEASQVRPPPPASAPAAAPAEEESEVDQLAQAQTLESAAESGAPLCEA
jgi:hypothetical protein